MGTQTSKKQQESVDPVARLMWALAFPGVSHAAGKVLAALASHADQRKLTCWPAVETLARETQVSRRGVQYALRKLETAGAIRTELSSGRSSSLYRLMIAPNPARIAPPNRAILALVNPARIAPLPRKDCAPQPRKDCAPTELSLEQSKREQSKQQQERAHEASGEASDEAPTTPAAAAANPIDSSSSKSKNQRHTCPKCERTWPEHYGPVCFDCDTYRRRKTEHRQDNNQRVLGLNWTDAELPAKIIDLHPKSDESSSFQALIEAPPPTADRKALADKLLKEMAEHDIFSGCDKAKPPAPHVSEKDQEEEKRAQEEYKRRQAELPSREESMKAIKDVLENAGYRTG